LETLKKVYRNSLKKNHIKDLKKEEEYIQMQIVSRVLSPEPPLPIITLKPEKKPSLHNFSVFLPLQLAKSNLKKKYSTTCTKKIVVQISLKMINCIEKKKSFISESRFMFSFLFPSLPRYVFQLIKTQSYK